MSHLRYPLVLWKDSSGALTGALLTSAETLYAHASSAREVQRQLRELVRARMREGDWLDEPDVGTAELLPVTVRVRPEFQIDERVLPADREVPLRLHCVHGKNDAGLGRAWLPQLRLSFLYDEHGSLRELCSHYVRSKLAGSTPQELLRRLPAPEVELGSLGVREEWRPPRYQRERSKLQRLARPLGERSLRRSLGVPHGREEEVKALVAELASGKARVCLVGPTGVGKTTLLAEAVRRVEREAGRERGLRGDDARLYWQTRGARLIAGQRYLGQWQEQVEEVLAELAERGGVLALENLREVLLAGGDSARSGIAAFLTPYLAAGELSCVVEATPEELDAARRHLPEFVECFRIVQVRAFDRARARAVLQRVAQQAAEQADLELEEGLTEVVRSAFARFAPHEGFPSAPAGFVRELCEDVASEGKERVSARAALARFSRRTGLPERFLRDDEPLRADALRAELEGAVRGQSAAIEAVLRPLLAFKAGVNDPARPLGVYLLCGPSGVGKTSLARALSKLLFGAQDGERRLVRLDMSEYGGPFAAERLLGGAQGEPGALVRAVRENPFRVLLLDEVEKASPLVFDALLGAFDEGRLTDPLGRVAHFQSTLFLLTSNLGAGAGSLGFGDDSVDPRRYEDAVRAFFRPELYNRLDGVVPFQGLSRATVRAIVEHELASLTEREGLRRREARLAWTEEVVDLLVAEGFDERYGARPLQRALEDLVVGPLSRWLVAHPECTRLHLLLEREERAARCRVRRAP